MNKACIIFPTAVLLPALLIGLAASQVQRGVTYGLAQADQNSPPTAGMRLVQVVDQQGASACSPTYCYWINDGSNGVPNDGCRAIWRWTDGIRNLGYVSRSSSAFIDVYDTSQTPYLYLPQTTPRTPYTSFPIGAPALSIVLIEGGPLAGYLVAAEGSAGIEVWNPASTATTPFYSYACPGVTFEYVMTNCDGLVKGLATSNGVPPAPSPRGRYFTCIHTSGGTVGCDCSGPYSFWVYLGPDTGSGAINNEYLVTDAKRNTWVATSEGPSRLNGTLFKFAEGLPTPVVFPGKGGRYVWPDLPYADGVDPCADPARPYIYVASQYWDSATMTDPIARLRRLDQSGQDVNPPVLYTCPPPPQSCTCPDYGPSDLLGPINVDVDEAPNPPLAGRVWIGLVVCGLRIFDTFTRSLGPVIGCGLGAQLGGSSSNTFFCPRNSGNMQCGCSTRLCSTQPQPPQCYGQPFESPWAKGNGSRDFRLFITPCCLPPTTGPQRR